MQPCDLRGRPQGEPIAPRDGCYEIPLVHFAPASVLIKKEKAGPQGMLHLTLRKRIETVPGSGRFESLQQQAAWEAEKTAVIVCDMWAKHWCAGARQRGAEMAPRINQLLQEARKRGVLVIHAPAAQWNSTRTIPPQASPSGPQGRQLAQGHRRLVQPDRGREEGKIPDRPVRRRLRRPARCDVKTADGPPSDADPGDPRRGRPERFRRRDLEPPGAAGDHQRDAPRASTRTCACWAGRSVCETWHASARTWSWSAT